MNLPAADVLHLIFSDESVKDELWKTLLGDF